MTSSVTCVLAYGPVYIDQPSVSVKQDAKCLHSSCLSLMNINSSSLLFPGVRFFSLNLRMLCQLWNLSAFVVADAIGSELPEEELAEAQPFHNPYFLKKTVPRFWVQGVTDEHFSREAHSALSQSIQLWLCLFMKICSSFWCSPKLLTVVQEYLKILYFVNF